MSHIAEYQCELSGINEELLKKVLEIVAKRLPGGFVSDTIDSVDEGDRLKVWGGKVCPQLQGW